MPLTKTKGNNYDWITHSHSHLAGECPHKCVYCYVDNPRFGRPEKYKGPLRLIEKEFDVEYGSGKTIFMENCNDLFAKEVPQEFIDRVVEHAHEWPENVYVWQTKNPERYLTSGTFPPKNIFGVTIETNRNIPEIGNAPRPIDRVDAMIRGKSMIKLIGQKFVTVEPILDFDVNMLVGWIREIKPTFVNIGADSKGWGLPEPSGEKIRAFIEGLKREGIEIREKHNLARLMS